MTANTIASRLLALFALCCATAVAQAPKDPPPWWGTPDEDTVSLHWDFNNAANPLAPTQQILPSWYSPLPTAANNFGFTNSGNITWIPTLAGNAGVMGFTGAGTGTISPLIENDYRLYWIKIFYLQYDSFAVAPSTVIAAVAKDLLKYERGIIEEKVEPLANGWTRTTLGMYLIPQPINEGVDFTLTEAAGNTVAIDNLFVNSKCVKPPPDAKGLALGEKDAAFDINLSALTGNACIAAAATEDANGVTTLWVSTRTGANADQVVRISAAGTVVGSPIPLPTPVAAANGASDLAIEQIPQALPQPRTRTFVYSVLDRRAANGTVALVAIDADLTLPAVDPTRQVVVNGLPGPGPLALAYSPHGDFGNGTFWIADQAGNVTEVTRTTGTVLRTLTAAQDGIPLGITGAAYDPLTANFYWFTNTPTPTPQGPTQIAGYMHDGYTLQPSGVQWLGDRTVPNPGGPPGGSARGLEVFRDSNGNFRLVCVQQAGNQTFLRVLHGPFQFGWSLLGRIGMRGGLPMYGNTTWQVTLRGVPRATGAICFIGFNNQQHLGVNLPIALTPLGLDENQLSISPSLQSSVLPIVNGGASFNAPLPPPGVLPANLPVFFQWLVFDPSVPSGLAASQAGETVIY